MELWRTVCRPGYFGRARDELIVKWNQDYGKGNWRLAYWNGEITVPRGVGLQIYEDGYFEYLKNSPKILDWLTSNFSNVYDTAKTNVESGFDYNFPQDTENNHVHDISIRRAVARLGTWFKGNRLLEVRGKDSEGGDLLSPGIVPFHRPRIIIPGELTNLSGRRIWWEQNSIEDFYQRNKLLQIRFF